MKERRYTPGAIELRGRDGKGATLVGHASVFDAPYELYGFEEQVTRGAFTRTIAEPHGVAALWNHDPSVVLGRDRSGTLRLAEDETGLAYEVDLPDTQAAHDVYTLIERGDVYQSSFAFEVIEERWDEPGEDRALPLRTLSQVRLYDVSPVTYPASPATDVDVARAMRSYAEHLGVETDTLAAYFTDLSKLRTDASASADDEPALPPVAEDTPEPARIQPVRLKGLNA